MKRYIKNLFIIALFASIHSMAQTPEQLFKAAGSPVNPKVAVSWNRYNDHAGISEICKKIAAAYPELAKLESIGKSYKGRDIWCLTITDFKKGDPNKKPGMYIDGNIHSNEVQGAEFSLYTAWYLTESFKYRNYSAIKYSTSYQRSTPMDVIAIFMNLIPAVHHARA